MIPTPNRRGAVTHIATRIILGIVVLWAFGTAWFIATQGRICSGPTGAPGLCRRRVRSAINDKRGGGLGPPSLFRAVIAITAGRERCD
jgi:hypothetical protein